MEFNIFSSYIKNSLFVIVPWLILMAASLIRDRYQPGSNFETHSWQLMTAVKAGIGCILYLGWHDYLYYYRLWAGYSEMMCAINALSIFFITTILWIYREKLKLVMQANGKSTLIAVAIVFIAFLLSLLGGPSILARVPAEETNYLKMMPLALAILTLSLQIFFFPLLEEFVFRGLLYAPLVRKFGKSVAIISCASIWALFHNKIMLIDTLKIFFMGVVLTFVYVRTKALVYSVALHVAMNSGILMSFLKNK